MGYSSAEEKLVLIRPSMLSKNQEVHTLPQAIHDLLQAKATLDDASDDVLYFAAMDRLAARWLAALAVTGVPPNILKGIRKNLMLLAATPKTPSVQGAVLALNDEAVSSPTFTNDEGAQQVLNEALLQFLSQGVESEEVLPEKRLSMKEVAELHKPLLGPLQDTVRGLIALDDLGDALSLRPEQAAALCFSAGLVQWAKTGARASDEEKTQVLSDWLAHRAVHSSLVNVSKKSLQRRNPSLLVASEMKSIGEARALALWGLSTCLVAKEGIEELQGEGFATLLKKARLPLDEVLDVMDLWSSLDEQGRI
ncbi:MAG: hypothetical protein GY822_13275 [Deltaproteobacteria bacterium]|nr:hypothetical protein [Deltaproteobacteria bacterium]